MAGKKNWEIFIQMVRKKQKNVADDGIGPSDKNSLYKIAKI